MRSGPGRVSPTGGRTVARIGVVGLALALLPVVGAAALAGAATPANAFKLSGSGSGTITPGSTASCLAGTEAGGVIELDDLVGSVSGYANVATWTVVINENKNGTFKIKADSTKDPTVALNLALKNGNASQGDKEGLDGTSGTVSVHGQSGSIDATVRNLTSSGYGKTMKLTGSWTCPASGA
jgi:hypothetical protein